MTLTAPVSDAQQRLWFLDRLSPGGAAYNIPTMLPIDGPESPERIAAAIDGLVERHGALRTTFVEIDGEPHQRVADRLKVAMAVVDLSARHEAERVRLLHAACRDEVAKPFDLAVGPLVRATLVRLAPDRQLLLLTLHHICADAWSLGILLADLAALLGGAAPAGLPPQRTSYADFARWQRERLSGPARPALLGYWRERLSGAPEVIALPFDRPRPPVQSFAGAMRSFQVPEAVAADLRRLAARSHATPFMVLLAAFDILLARYSGCMDFVVGTPYANRSRPEHEAVVGLVANTLALRFRLSGDPSFLDVLDHVRETSLSAYEHADMPFERLVAELQPARARDHTPVFQVLFALQNTPTLASARALSGDAILPDPDSLFATAKFDLSLLMGETPDTYVGSFEYSTDLFDAATIESMLASFQTLLRSIAAKPSAPMSRLSLLDAAGRRDLLDACAPPPVCAPGCVHDAVADRIARSGPAVALRGGGQALSYAQLGERADALARALAAHGVATGGRVGVLMAREPLAMIAVLAILKAGAAFVPLDPHLPEARLRLIARDAKLDCVLRAPGAGDFLADAGTALIDCTEALWQAHHAPSGFPAGKAGPDDIAYIVYTSGSTGLPKGVAMPHAALHNLVRTAMLDSPMTAPATLSFAAWGFDIFLQEIFATWIAGGTLVLAPEAARRDPVLLLDLLRAEGIERLHLPPVALYQVAEAGASARAALPRLKEICTSGEALRVTPAVRRWLSLLPGCALVNHYGPAESHVMTEHRLEGDPAHWPALPPIGRPLPGATLLVLDQAMNPVPDGVPGEIFIGRQIARGYLDRPALNAERFVAPPFAPAMRLYRTGDLARRRRDGIVDFLGRLDRQVKIRGYRVEPGEVDAALALHPSVQAAATVVPPDEETKRLVAYVVAKPGCTVDSGELRRFLAARLAEYMIPAAFVAIDRLPTNDNGKLDVRALPPPATSRDTLDAPYQAPQPGIEDSLATLWRDLLRIDRVGARDDFFALGGHSLLAVRLISRVRDRFGVDLSVATVFESPTIAGLAPRITAAMGEEKDGLEDLLAEIAAMSDDEAAEALLQSEDA